MTMGGADMPSLGGMQDRIHLTRRHTMIGDGGRQQHQDEPLGSAWAKVRHRTLAPVERGGRREFPRVVDFALNYASDFEAADRVHHQGKSYVILTSEIRGGTRKVLILRCEESRPLKSGRGT